MLLIDWKTKLGRLQGGEESGTGGVARGEAWRERGTMARGVGEKQAALRVLLLSGPCLLAPGLHGFRHGGEERVREEEGSIAPYDRVRESV
jgi:hypothetical protein